MAGPLRKVLKTGDELHISALWLIASTPMKYKILYLRFFADNMMEEEEPP
jgi:hypothetical protein